MRWWFVAKDRGQYVRDDVSDREAMDLRITELLGWIGGSIEGTRFEKAASKCQAVERI